MASAAEPLYSIPEAHRKGTTAGSPVEAMRRYMESLPKEPTVKEELADQRFWRAVRTEFLSTALLTVLGCGSCLRWTAPPRDSATASAVELRVALAFGLGVATLARGVGGHMNPAVTAALLVARRVSACRGLACVVAQCLGGLVGAVVLYGLCPPGLRQVAGLGATEPAVGVSAHEAFGLEFLATAVVAITALAATEADGGAEDRWGCEALTVGLAYVVGHLLAFPYTGASLNPARSLGPAIVTNTWRLHWVYWVAPLLGGIIGGVTYDYTQESRSQQALRVPYRKRLNRDMSALSSNETELTVNNDHCRL